MSSTKGCKCTGGMFLREQSGVSHLEGHQWPQNTHIPRRRACRTCVASASSLSRVSSPFSCAAPPAPRWREPAARDARVCRVPPAPCSEHCVLSCRKLGCAPVLCFRANDLLVSAEFGLGVSTDVTKSSKNITKKYKQPFLEP